MWCCSTYSCAFKLEALNAQASVLAQQCSTATVYDTSTFMTIVSWVSSGAVQGTNWKCVLFLLPTAAAVCSVSCGAVLNTRIYEFRRSWRPRSTSICTVWCGTAYGLVVHGIADGGPRVHTPPVCQPAVRAQGGGERVWIEMLISYPTDHECGRCESKWF
jgi:hypothetical protein